MQSLKCVECGADRGGVIDLVRDGKKAELRCFQCNAQRDAQAGAQVPGHQDRGRERHR